MPVQLREYRNETDIAADLIRQFWKAHNNYKQSQEESLQDLKQWTDTGHKLFLICKDEAIVGFVHLGSRGGEPDWLEDIFVIPDYQNQGIGTFAIRMIENEVKKYSPSLYIEAAARNQRAIMLYRRLGYDCLNTITVRKDFNKTDFDVVRSEKIYDLDFEIKLPADGKEIL